MFNELCIVFDINKPIFCKKQDWMKWKVFQGYKIASQMHPNASKSFQIWNWENYAENIIKVELRLDAERSKIAA